VPSLRANKKNSLGSELGAAVGRWLMEGEEEGGHLEDYSRPAEELPFADIEELDRSSGLFVEFPVCMPVRLVDGELIIDAALWDLEEELKIVFEEWQEDRLTAKILTGGGSGAAYQLHIEDVSLTLNMGDIGDKKP
jgi:hypothetical protein